MSEKKYGPKIIFSAFVVLCLLLIIWFVVTRFVKIENNENRELAARPSVSVESYQTFASDFEAYLNDRLPFRNQLVALNSAIDFWGFNKSSSDKTIIGKEDWLFYSDVTDGDPIACYQGTNLFSAEELALIASNLTQVQQELEAQGCEFVFYIAPNKERIYYEYMPEIYGEPAIDYRATQLIGYLQRNTSIRVVYPYDELMRNKEWLGENLYYKNDTHWNKVGGYIGTRVLLNELGIELPDIKNDEISITQGEHVAGDLADNLNLSSILKKNDFEYEVSGYDEHNSKNLAYEFYQTYEYSAENADPRTIYVLRDSFATNMADIIGSQFNHTYMRHQNTYTYDDYAAVNPDIFVLEMSERKLWRMPTFSLY